MIEIMICITSHKNGFGPWFSASAIIISVVVLDLFDASPGFGGRTTAIYPP